MAPELHNSLERFLLFRKLYPFEKEAPSFARVSEALKQDEILLSSDSFDAARLEPEALQSLYLQTLKDEANFRKKWGHDDQQSQTQRKQKLSSPGFDTLEEAAQYAHLIPELVDRLYFNYQRYAVEAIRKEETLYHSLQEKSGDKERKERENRQEFSDVSTRPASHGVPSIQTLLRHEEEKSAQDFKEQRLSYPNGSPYQDSTQPVMNGLPLTANSGIGQEGRIPSNDPRYVQPNHPPHFPPHQYPAQSYPPPLSGPEAHRQRSSQPLPSPSPRMNQVSIPPPDRSSASPIILPPVSGMLRSQGTPAGPLEPVSEAGQPYRPSPNMSPRPGQPALARPHSQQAPANRNYSHPAYSYHDGRQYSNFHSYGQQGYYNQYPGPPSNIPQGSPYGTSTGYPSAGPTHPSQHNGYYPPQGYYNHNQSPIPTNYSHQQPPRYGGQQTPKQDNSRHPLQLSSVKMSGSATKWKHVDLGAGVKPPGSPTRPPSRDISPISDKVDSADQDMSPAASRVAKLQHEAGNSAPAATAVPVRGRPSRNSGRPVNAAPTPASARDGTRSQSVASRTDEVSTEARVPATRSIKPEPSIASAHDDEASTMDESSRKRGRRRRGTLKEDDPPVTPRVIPKRKRGDSSLPLPSPAHDQPLEKLPMTPEVNVMKRPGYVLATRNLPKISSTLMQTVTAHKDAYLFLKPLTERDAPGYNKLIYRPQDFKAIKSALVAGSKAVAAIVEGADEEVDQGLKSIWIPETEEVVPPKGIVNSAQLEKELLRIFANAVMFNPELAENRGLGIAFHTRARTLEERRSGSNENADGEALRSEIGVAKPVDGAVVKDTREMCTDVEEAFDAWRGIGKVDDAEAREAPVIGHPSDVAPKELKGKGGTAKNSAVETVEAGDEEDKEASEEPRPKRRRRQL